MSKRPREELPQTSLLLRKRSRNGSTGSVEANFYVVHCEMDNVHAIFTDFEQCKKYLDMEGAIVTPFNTYEEAQHFANLPVHEVNVPQDSTPRNDMEIANNFPLEDQTDFRTTLLASLWEQSRRVVVYANGTTSTTRGEPAKMGYGIYFGDKSPFNMAGCVRGSVSSQRADLKAALEALKGITKHNMVDLGGKIDLTVNSTYVKNGFDSWMQKWKLSGWRNANKGDIKNLDLWKEVDTTLAELKQTQVHVCVTIGSGTAGSFAAGRMAEQAMRDDPL